KYFNAERALRLNGAPHLDPDQQRWMTDVKGLKEAARIEGNLRKGDLRALEEELGQWDIFMRDSDMAGPILSEYETTAQRQLAQQPLTDEKLRLLGYDAKKQGLPIEFAPYEVPAGAKILTIDVPDRMLEEPLSHRNVADKFVMLNPSAAQRKALAEA